VEKVSTQRKRANSNVLVSYLLAIAAVIILWTSSSFAENVKAGFATIVLIGWTEDLTIEHA